MICLGIAAILSGDYASLGREMKAAAEMAVEDCNEQGGVCGVKVSTCVLDDRGNVEQARLVAEEFCSRLDVLAVIGHFGSDASIAASEIYSACDLPMITPIASNPVLTERGLANVFRFTNRDNRTGPAIAGFLRDEKGKRRAVLIQSDYAYGKSMTGQFSSAFTKAGGQIAAWEKIAVGQRDFDSLLDKLPEQFDVLFYGGAFEGAYLLKTMRRRGMTQLFAAGDGCWDLTSFLQPAGEAANQGEGVLVLSATPSGDRMQGFAARYGSRYGPITNYAVNSYDATRVLLASIHTAGQRDGIPPGRRSVTAVLRTSHFQGIAYERPVRWDEKGDNLSAVTALYTAEAGAFRQVAIR
jgi:branched-chain amino acid transport system substrate-binding protein